MTDLSKKLFPNRRYELFWNEGESAGTCFSEEHIPEEKLKRLIFRGMKKVPVASARFVPEPTSVLTKPNSHEIFSWNSFNHYLSPPNQALNWTGGFEELKDCLWKITYGDKVFDYLQFEDENDLLTFLRSNFLVDGSLNTNLQVEAYLIEDNQMVFPSKLKGSNAAWMALKGKIREPYVDPNALGDSVRLDNLLTAIWNHTVGLPPLHTTELLCKGTHLVRNRRNNREYFRKHRAWIGIGGVSRRMHYDGSWQNVNSSYLISPSVWDNKLLGVNILSGGVDHIHRTMRYTPSREVSFIESVGVLANQAIYISPYDVDTIFFPYFDASELEVQIVRYEGGKKPIHHTPTNPDVYGQYNNVNHNNGCRLKKPDWFDLNTKRPVKIGRDQYKYGFRYHKKGSPFVSRESDSYLTSLSSNARNYPKYVLQRG